MTNQTTIHRQTASALLAIAASALLINCSSDSGSGNAETGGMVATATTGGAKASGGAATLGGSRATGGSAATGGATSASGGVNATGGTTSALGGSSAAAGGTRTGAGGSSASGGTAGIGVGGITSTGGISATGGSSTADAGNNEDGGYAEDGGEQTTFSMLYANVLSARCVSCHAPGGVGVTVGKLDLSTKQLAYADLVGPSAMGMAAAGTQCATSSLLRVTPRDHATSLLWEKVNAKLQGTAAPCGNPMPAGGSNAPLTQAQVDQIAEWIDSGALDN